MDKTDGNGADVFFECVGSNEVASLAVDCAAPAGSVCFVGNPHSDMMFEKNVYWKILRNQLTINGTWNSSFLGADAPDDDWHYVLGRLEKGSVSPEKLITQRYSLEDIHKGFELMRDKTEDYVKVMYVKED
jgi:L-iditol 2-dehydrogenase